MKFHYITESEIFLNSQKSNYSTSRMKINIIDREKKDFNQTWVMAHYLLICSFLFRFLLFLLDPLKENTTSMSTFPFLNIYLRWFECWMYFLHSICFHFVFYGFSWIECLLRITTKWIFSSFFSFNQVFTERTWGT